MRGCQLRLEAAIAARTLSNCRTVESHAASTNRPGAALTSGHAVTPAGSPPASAKRPLAMAADETRVLVGCRRFRDRLLMSTASAVAIAAAACWPRRSTAQARFDVLIRGGQVIDGTGGPARRADVGITGDRITAVGDLATATRGHGDRRRRQATSPRASSTSTRTPGPGLATAELKHGRPVLAQGITTVLVNPDGGGPIDLAAQRAGYQRDGIGLNVGLMVPHGSVRREVLGMSDRDPTAAELARMVALVRDGMRAGAFGLSSGLYYAPGSYSKTDEVVAMAKAAAAGGGSYSSHIRDEADYGVGVVAAVDEVITIAEQGGLIGVVTHMKALGPASWGLSKTMVAHIEAARARGVPRLRRSVSLRGQRHQHRRGADAALGAGRRPRRHAAAPHRRAARQGARGGEGEPGPARRRRHVPGRRVRAGHLDRGPAPVRAGRQGRTGARGIRADAARKGRRRPRLVQHGRGRHRIDHAPAVDDDLHRRRPAAGHRGQAAPARLRRLSAQAGPLRPRSRRGRAAVCDPLDDGALGRGLRPQGSRRAAARRLRRRRRLRPGGSPGRGHLRAAAPAGPRPRDDRRQRRVVRAAGEFREALPGRVLRLER